MGTLPYLYVTDLDGTLLDERGRLSARSRTGLLALLERGVPITVATARSYCSISAIFGDMPFSLPIIEFNGAFITDYATGEHLETNSIARYLAFELFDLIESSGHSPFVSSFNGREDCLHYCESLNAAMKWYEQRRRKAGDPRLRKTKDLRCTMSEDVVSLTIMGDDESSIMSLMARIQESYGAFVSLYCYENAYSPGTYWLTVHDRRANKRTAIESLKRRIGVPLEVVALGDNVNDIEMLEAADQAIVVQNAVPELHALAHRIIPPHHTDSVIAFLEAEAARIGA